MTESVQWTDEWILIYTANDTAEASGLQHNQHGSCTWIMPQQAVCTSRLITHLLTGGEIRIMHAAVWSGDSQGHVMSSAGLGSGPFGESHLRLKPTVWLTTFTSQVNIHCFNNNDNTPSVTVEETFSWRHCVLLSAVCPLVAPLNCEWCLDADLVSGPSSCVKSFWKPPCVS